MKYILGIDVGTQSVKAGLVSLPDLVMVRTASRPYPGTARQDPDLIWNSTVEAIKELTQSAPGEICAIGFSGQMHGTVLYDRVGNVIGPIINWQDESGNRPSDTFDRKIAVEVFSESCDPYMNDLGVDVQASGFLGITLFVIKHTDPDLYKKIAHVSLPTDFVRSKLTGEKHPVTDPTNAFSTGLFNVPENKWHEEAINSVGIDYSLLPDVVETTAITGTVTKDAASLTGLSEGTPVACGGGDNQMAIIGSGINSPDSPILINIGTSAQVCAIIPEYVKIPGIDTRSFIGGNFALVGASLTGGMVYTWFRDLLLDDIKLLGGTPPDSGSIFQSLDSLAAKAPHGCDELKFAPYLRGSRRSPDLRANFTRISMDNFSLGHRARSVLEGVVDELIGFYDRFPGISAEKMVGAGNGLVKSDLWCKIAAGMFELPLFVMDFENAVYGAALVAAEAIDAAKIIDGRFDYVKKFLP